MENENKVGKEFTVCATQEDYTVLEQSEQGYLLVQNSAFRRAQMAVAKDLIHISEIDGVYAKWHQ